LGTEFTSGATASALGSGVATAFCTVLSAVASSELFSSGAGRALLLVEDGRRAFPIS